MLSVRNVSHMPSNWTEHSLIISFNSSNFGSRCLMFRFVICNPFLSKLKVVLSVFLLIYVWLNGFKCFIICCIWLCVGYIYMVHSAIRVSAIRTGAVSCFSQRYFLWLVSWNNFISSSSCTYIDYLCILRWIEITVKSILHIHGIEKQSSHGKELNGSK